MTDQASGALPEAHNLYAPGLKRRARITGPDARYFVVPAHDVKAGYALRTLTIPAAASEQEAAAMCRRYWAELVAWRAGEDKTPTAFTFAWLVDDYLNNPHSTFRTVREKTRRAYEQNCRIIRATIGKRHLDMLRENGVEVPRYTGADIRRWHNEWGLPIEVIGPDGKPMKDNWGNVITAPTAPSRARHCIVQLRILAKHMVLIAKPTVAASLYLRNLLSEMEFATTKAREVAITRAQVNDFVKAALAKGYPSQAITTLAQFELIERRVHIIGYFEGKPKQWRPGWIWQNIDHAGPNATWRIRYYQDKVGRVLRDFDLKTVPDLLALIQAIPEAQRIGPVIIAERQRKAHLREPWNERHYAEVWREIAREAGIPDQVWSMDARAGGTTEADTIPEITDRMMDDAGGWTDPKTKTRYRRNKQRNAGEVVNLRQRARSSEERS